jgi:hypothetical protein
MLPAGTERAGISRSRLALTRNPSLGCLPSRRYASPPEQSHSDAGDAQGQVRQVIEHGVPVGQQPVEGGHHVAQETDHQIDDPQHQDHVAGQPGVRPPEADVGQEAASDEVDDVLQDVGVQEPRTSRSPTSSPTTPTRSRTTPSICAYRRNVFSSSSIFVDRCANEEGRNSTAQLTWRNPRLMGDGSSNMARVLRGSVPLSLAVLIAGRASDVPSPRQPSGPLRPTSASPQPP